MSVKEKDDSLVIVYTGNGKGKTTAALGTAFRALGYGWKICMIQFIKGTWKYGEMESVKLFPDIFELHRTGKGYYKIQNDNLPEEEHRKAAKRGLNLAREKIQSRKYRLVILDEVLIAIQSGLLQESDVLDIVSSRPDSVHIILTGRGASERIMEIADMVTEMKEVKHPFRKGIPAQKGIDY